MTEAEMVEEFTKEQLARLVTNRERSAAVFFQAQDEALRMLAEERGAHAKTAAALATERRQRDEEKRYSDQREEQVAGIVRDFAIEGDYIEAPNGFIVRNIVERLNAAATRLAEEKRVAESRATAAEARANEAERLAKVRAENLEMVILAHYRDTKELVELRTAFSAAESLRKWMPDAKDTDFTNPHSRFIKAVDRCRVALDALPAPPAVKEPGAVGMHLPDIDGNGMVESVPHPRGSDGERELYRDPHAPEPAADLARRLGFPKTPEAQRRERERDHYLSTMVEPTPAEILERTGTWTGETRPTDEMLAKAWQSAERHMRAAGVDVDETVARAGKVIDSWHTEAAPGANVMDAPSGPQCACGAPSIYESGWCGHRCEASPHKAGHCKRCGGQLKNWDHCVACSAKATEAAPNERLVPRYDPPPPETLVDALQDSVHATSGRLIASKPIRVPMHEAAPGERLVPRWDSDTPDQPEWAWVVHGDGWALMQGRFSWQHGYNRLTVGKDGFDKDGEQFRQLTARILNERIDADRLRTIIDEAFSMQPVTRGEELLSLLERCLSEQSTRERRLLAERDALARKVEELDSSLRHVKCLHSDAATEAQEQRDRANREMKAGMDLARMVVERSNERDTAVSALEEANRKAATTASAQPWIESTEAWQKWARELLPRTWGHLEDAPIRNELARLLASVEAGKRELWLRATKAQQGMNGGEWTPLAPYEPAKGE